MIPIGIDKRGSEMSLEQAAADKITCESPMMKMGYLKLQAKGKTVERPDKRARASAWLEEQKGMVR